MNNDIISKLEELIAEFNNNYCDEYADGVVDGLIMAIRLLKEQ